ncbi:MAG: hypothetical protein K6U87_11155 [Firmicutes bacterium]|nr:hypothetical protein [Bacillota bacterium]
MTLNRMHLHRRRWPALLGGGLLAAVAVAGPAFAADLPEPPHPAPPGSQVAITPADGATNVAPTASVTLRWPARPQPPMPHAAAPMRPDDRAPDPRPAPRMPAIPDLVVAVTNAQGTTLYGAQSPTVSIDRAAGTVTWTPAPETVDGVTTSVLGRYTEDSVAFVRGPLPGLSPQARQALREDGTVALAGQTLADLLFPQPPVPERPDPGRGDAHRPPAPPRPIRGEIAGIQGQTITFFGGQSVTVPADARVQIPGVPHGSLSDLRPGEFVQVHLPPTGLRPAAIRRADADPPAPAALVQVLPTPGVVDTVFTTGSAVGEPVAWQAQAASTQPSVLTGDAVTITARDSYGNPATTGSFQVVGQASPSLDPSFQAPAGTIQDGQGQTTVTDHKAQAVTLAVQTSGPFSQDSQSIALGTVQFQPGPPAAMTIQAASPMTAGGQDAVTGVVTDVYGNPVLPSALDLTASAGSVKSPVTTQAGTGAYSTQFTAPTKLDSAPGTGEPVTLAGRSEQGSAAAQAQVTVNPGPVAQLTLQAPSQVLAGQTATITGTAADVYGNAALNGTAIDLAASAGSVPASAPTQVGQFQATFQAPAQPGPVTISATANGHQAQATLQVVAPAPSGSAVKITLAAGSGGSVAVTGTVTAPNGAPVAGAPVTLTVIGATPGTLTVATDSQGAFSAQVTPATSQGAVTVTASVPTQGGGSASGQGWIDPLVYGNQAWTDTGLVVSAGQLVCVQATGSWAGQLYAAVNGSQGVPVQVGANGCFVSSVSGTLYLGTNGASQSGTVDANVAITAPNAVPTLDLTTSTSTVAPGGQATVSGQLMEGPYPVVGATIDLGATAGSLSASTATTDGQGQFQATWTAPQSGSATITASYQPAAGNAITQTVSETVSGATTPPPPSSSNPLASLFWSSLGTGSGYNQWQWVQDVEPPTCSFCKATMPGPYVGMLQYFGISGNGTAAAYVPAPAGSNFTQLSWQGFVYNGISTMAPASVVAVVQTSQGVSLQPVWTVPSAQGFLYGGPSTITLPPNTVGLVMVVRQVNANWYASNWMLLLESPTVTLSTGGTSPLFPAPPTTETGSPGFPVPA